MGRNKGFYITEEHKKKLSDAHKGIKLSPEHIQKLSDAHKGIKLSPEHIQKLKGRHHSEETCKKISNANLGRKFSEEHCRNLSNALMSNKNSLGRKITEEHRKNLSYALIGKKLSKETRKKISDTRKGKYCGDKSSSWKGGISFAPYCQKFNKEFKERVRKFFNYRCQGKDCNYIWQPGEKKLHVHHVKYNKKACCDGDNTNWLFVPLCTSCHMKTNHKRSQYEEFFTNKIMSEYDGNCYLPLEV
jgi:hypothetical protein